MRQRDKQREYNETRAHWQTILESVGIARVREAYRDALFMVVPHHRLAALRDTITAHAPHGNLCGTCGWQNGRPWHHDFDLDCKVWTPAR